MTLSKGPSESRCLILSNLEELVCHLCISLALLVDTQTHYDLLVGPLGNPEQVFITWQNLREMPNCKIGPKLLRRVTLLPLIAKILIPISPNQIKLDRQTHQDLLIGPLGNPEQVVVTWQNLADLRMMQICVFTSSKMAKKYSRLESWQSYI